MDDQTSRPVSQRVVDALDASVRDIAEGNLHDAQAVLVEARRMLAEHERAQRAGSRSAAAARARRVRSA
jgi:hypothetical protein